MTYTPPRTLAAFFVYLVIRYLNQTDVPKIRGLPEIPGIPLFGNLIQLGTCHHVAAQKLADKYGPVFQARLGSKRVVYVNSFEAVKSIWITQQSALISCLTLHIFYKVINNDGKSFSSSESFPVGASPWDESCTQRKKAIASAITFNLILILDTTSSEPRVHSYMPFVDLEVMESLKELHDSSIGDLDIKPYIQPMALNMSPTTCYGYRISRGVNDALLREITDVEKKLTMFRGTSSNWQDFIPLLHLGSKKNIEANACKLRRQKYIGFLHDILKEKVAVDTDKPCVAGSSIGMPMVSGGLDTLPGNIIMAIGYLSSDHGAEIQKRAYEEIIKVYADGDAWKKCLEGEKVAYITALTKETLRFWSTIPISLPRVNIALIQYQGAMIPPGTAFLHPPHYAYGAGSRMCAGVQLANRELYVFLVRIIVAFEVVPAQNARDRPVLDALKCNADPSSLTMMPKPFKVGSWIIESEMRTNHLV
ncbi:cytochrome P450 [Mytilinidion resinicola]|uniref:Cytochrome P450 n=1 Tax=Mytilinidion resinicola TaxID=574789 RepID=A0A6A6YZ78_9PEZI|nr:cytochrome P450 [Mytilinidion resinicola]KAF2813848.1 cytochrome P450 [Mytilinidion resinicola]